MNVPPVFAWMAMLEAVYQVSRGLINDLGSGNKYSLEHIANAVEAYSPIDKVIYVEFSVSNFNPIWGQFWKFGQTPNSYTSYQTVVEVRYASHLSTAWRRFVVAKELCHSLDADTGSHSVTDRAIDRIMNSFSLLSAAKMIKSSFPAFDAETMAEIGALELLCPLEVRKSLTANVDYEALCNRFGIPSEYKDLAFGNDYINLAENLI